MCVCVCVWCVCVCVCVCHVFVCVCECVCVVCLYRISCCEVSDLLITLNLNDLIRDLPQFTDTVAQSDDGYGIKAAPFKCLL